MLKHRNPLQTNTYALSAYALAYAALMSRCPRAVSSGRPSSLARTCSARSSPRQRRKSRVAKSKDRRTQVRRRVPR